MKLRILKIAGRGKKARAQQLQWVQAWMEIHGWQLMHYSEGADRAAFGRAPGAPPLGWFDATRWLPGPDWKRPGAWLGTGQRPARELAILAAVGLIVGAAFFGVLSYSYSGPSSLFKAGARYGEESWLYVNANSLNVRVSPLSQAQIVGVLYRNQKVLVDQTNEGWARVVKPERGLPHWKSSARVITIRTGSPALRESTAAAASSVMAILPPNPPPTSVGTTRTRL